MSIVRFLAGFLPQLKGFLDRALQLGGRSDCKKFIDVDLQLLAVGIDGKAHSKTELGVVLKETVAPRGTLTVALANGVRGGRERSAVDRGTTCRVGDDHPIATDLGDHLHVGSLAAAGAGAAELKEWLLELKPLDRVEGASVDDVVRELLKELGVDDLAGIALDLNRTELEALDLRRTGFDTTATTLTVLGVHLNLELKIPIVFGDRLQNLERLGSILQALRLDLLRPDRSVRTALHALVALDAVLGDPLGNERRHAALLKLGRTGGKRSVEGHLGNRNVIALEVHDRLDNLLQNRSNSGIREPAVALVIVLGISTDGAHRRRRRSPPSSS